MFEHMLKRHDVLFVYVGAESPLKEKYNDAASELIVYTYFFSASEEALPESLSLPELPAVVVFKDGSHFTYDGLVSYQTGSLDLQFSPSRFSAQPTGNLSTQLLFDLPVVLCLKEAAAVSSGPDHWMVSHFGFLSSRNGEEDINKLS
ncbi:Protein disulfide-isomerase tmx3 [Ilyodon furcidens]|uniref:protein disulfide-isomerase n=1 Tax=Ilyodon furcidens TaxID=33524 RepID=A0ABV0T3S6_9TELE